MSKSSLPESEILTRPIRFETGVPFLQSEGPPSKVGAAPDFKPSKTKKLVIDACSEFTEYTASTEYFKKNGKIHLVHDKIGQPVVFSLGEDKRLYLLTHVSGGTEGWFRKDITPKNQLVETFDIVQSSDVFVAATVNDEQGFSILYHCSINLEDFKSSKKWAQVKDNDDHPVGPLIISSLTCSILPFKTAATTSFQIIAGTAAQDKKIATHYTVDPADSAPRRWTALSFPAAASKLVQTEPLVLGNVRTRNREYGVVSLFKGFPTEGDSRCMGHVIGPDGGVIQDFEFKAGQLEGISGVYSHYNPWRLTDVFIAGKRGIGVFDHQHIDTLDQRILPEISFKQVVCNEYYDVSKPTEPTKITMFAVSEEGDLYYIQGGRDLNSRKMSFDHSGFPIRKGVTHMAVKYNTSYYSSELLYAGGEDNALHHLRRTVSGDAWIEDSITFKGRKTIKYDAYVTSLLLSDGSGNRVPAGYPISVTSDPLHVVANGKAYSLSRVSTKLQADESGCVLIVIPSSKKLGCFPLEVKVSLDPTSPDITGNTFNFTVDPAQRTNRLIGNFKSGKSMQSATSLSGEKLFQNDKMEDLDEVSKVLSQVDLMKEKMKNPSGTNWILELGGDGDTWYKEALVKTGQTIEIAAKYLGDFLETVKYQVKRGVKWVIKSAGPVLSVAFKIAGKIFSFVIDALDKLLTTIGNFLENYLGLDFLNRFLKFLKAIFDPKSIIKTQNVLKDIVNGALTVVDRTLEVNREGVTDIFDDAASLMKEYIEDTRAPKRENVSNPLAWIFDNPVIRLLSKMNPLAWIMEAITEEIPDLKLPSVEPLMTRLAAVIGTFSTDQFSVLLQLWDTVVQQMITVLNDPSQILEALIRTLKASAWTVFDSIRTVVLSLYDAFHIIIQEVSRLLTETWKIPGLTDLWEKVTGSEFSLMNFMTYPAALLMNLYCLISNSKLPFERWKKMDFNAIEIKPFYKSKLKIAPTPTSIKSMKGFKSSITTEGTTPISESATHMAPPVFTNMIAAESSKLSSTSALPPTPANESTTTRAQPEQQVTSNIVSENWDMIFAVLTTFENLARISTASIGIFESVAEIKAKAGEDKPGEPTPSYGFNEPDYHRGSLVLDDEPLDSLEVDYLMKDQNDWMKFSTTALNQKMADPRKATRVVRALPIGIHGVFVIAHIVLRQVGNVKTSNWFDGGIVVLGIAEIATAAMYWKGDRYSPNVQNALVMGGEMTMCFSTFFLAFGLEKVPAAAIASSAGSASGAIGVICRACKYPLGTSAFYVGDAVGSGVGCILAWANI